ncbi:MAG: hypothetical protein N3E51_04645, partial [Candidatus Micrarchaeota archaeon]|nr:hypothetical protein [Candidatus Micrarchaeota archaeon]
MALPEKEKGVYLLPKSLDKQIDIALNHIDYESWFSDHMAKGYVGMFPVRLSMCKTEDERESVMLEAEIIV